MKKIEFFAVAVSAVLAVGVAKAEVYDLSSAGTDSVTVTGGIGGTALFNVYVDSPAGTGYIDPFLRTQLVGSAGSYCAGTVTGNCEQGYNTDGVEEFDTKEQGGHNWNHSLLLADIPIVTIDGVEYREFLLDINQNEGGTDNFLLSLDELQFFTTSDPAISGYNDANNDFGSNANLVWEMDTYTAGRDDFTKDDYINLENCKTPGTCGSGDFDLQALIPNSAFVGGDYVVLFNRFGDNTGSTGANAGFEEWAVRSATEGSSNQVPEPGILALMFAGLLAGWTTRRRPTA